jgi:hypothetical protein
MTSLPGQESPGLRCGGGGVSGPCGKKDERNKWMVVSQGEILRRVGKKSFLISESLRFQEGRKKEKRHFCLWGMGQQGHGRVVGESCHSVYSFAGGCELQLELNLDLTRPCAMFVIRDGAEIRPR